MLFNKVTTLSLVSTLARFVSAETLPPIEIVGSKFFFSNNGSQFYIRGVAYQADSANLTASDPFVDPLADFETCSRDIPYLQELDTNVIRVYALNVSLDHSKCMQALSDAGIYVIADLSQPDESINRNSPEWNVELYQRYTSVVDKFHNYTNMLGFFAGNEVTNDANNTDASPFVKAAIRDTKAYIKEQGYRQIPVGYSSNDDAQTRVKMADYFACGNVSERADFYGINMYEWCGSSTFEKSGYAARTKEFSNLTIPVFFSEYGCNVIQPRTFQSVAALYSDEMTDVWSGGIVYMYFEEVNNYGLVTVSDGKVSTLADFGYYSSEIHAISPTSDNTASYTPTSTILSCPPTGPYWKAATSLPPTPNNNLCDCMVSSLSCVVSDTVSADKYQDLFDYVCSQVSCAGIGANGTSGVYGGYSFCRDKDKLSFVLNMYYKSQGSSKDACNFSGSASLQSATTQAACSQALSQVGTLGTGSATVSISSVSRSSNSGSSRTTGSSSTSSSKVSGAVSNKSNVFQILATAVFTISMVAGLGFVIA